MKANKLFFSIFLLIILPNYSHATIIEGTFHGTVTHAYDNADGNPPSPYFNNLWSNDIIGKSLTGSFSYDTDLVPINSGTTGQFVESFSNNWLGVSFIVDGKTFDISQTIDNFTTTFSYEKLHINDVNGYSVIRDFTQEYFSVWEDVLLTNGQLQQHLYGGVSFLDTILPVLSGNTLHQDFTWQDSGGSFDALDDVPALAYLGVDNFLNDKRDQGAVIARVSDITVSARPKVSVPEPSSTILLGIGILGLVLRRRKLA